MKTTARFVFVGVIGATVELTMFSCLISIDGKVMLSNIIAFHCAFAICFILHYYYTHKKPYVGKYKIAIGFFKYSGLMYAQLMVGTLLLWLLINKLGWMPEVAKVAQIGIVTPVSYAVQKLVIFRMRSGI